MFVQKAVAFTVGVVVALAFVVLVTEINTWYVWRGQVTSAINQMLKNQAPKENP